MSRLVPFDDRTEALRWLNDSLARARSFQGAREVCQHALARGGAGSAYFLNLLYFLDNQRVSPIISNVELELYRGFFRKLYREGQLESVDLHSLEQILAGT